MMKRRSVLMRLLGLCGFAVPGLNAVADMIGKSNGSGWIGLAIINDGKARGDCGGYEVPPAFKLDADAIQSYSLGKFDYSGRFTEKIDPEWGPMRCRWEDILPGDWILITDRNERGSPIHQSAFVAKGKPDTSDPMTMPVKAVVVPLDMFWDHVADMNKRREDPDHEVADWDAIAIAHEWGNCVGPPAISIIREIECTPIDVV